MLGLGVVNFSFGGGVRNGGLDQNWLTPRLGSLHHAKSMENLYINKSFYI